MTAADDVAKLREEYPRWRFGTVWATAASGPDARRLWATRDGITVTAWNASELRLKIAFEERQAENPAGR
jgi:hypothetical protein